MELKSFLKFVVSPVVLLLLCAVLLYCSWNPDYSNLPQAQLSDNYGRLVIDGREYRSSQFETPRKTKGEVIAVVGDDAYRVCVVEGEDPSNCVSLWDMALMNSGMSWLSVYIALDATGYETDSFEIESIVVPIPDLRSSDEVIEDASSIAEMTTVYRGAAAETIAEADPATLEYLREYAEHRIELHFFNHRSLCQQIWFQMTADKGCFLTFLFDRAPFSGDQRRMQVVPVSDDFLSLSTYYEESL